MVSEAIPRFTGALHRRERAGVTGGVERPVRPDCGNLYASVTARPGVLREQVAANLVRCISPGGSLLVICAGRDESDEPGSMPWPLTRADLIMFEQVGLRETSFEDLLSQEEPFFRHFRIHYQK